LLRRGDGGRPIGDAILLRALTQRSTHVGAADRMLARRPLFKPGGFTATATVKHADAKEQNRSPMEVNGSSRRSLMHETKRRGKQLRRGSHVTGRSYLGLRRPECRHIPREDLLKVRTERQAMGASTTPRPNVSRHRQSIPRNWGAGSIVSNSGVIAPAGFKSNSTGFAGRFEITRSG
jgi:hypothetical protein